MKYTLDSLRHTADDELAVLEKKGLVVAVCENNDLPALRYLVDERHLPIEREYDESLPLMAAAAYGSTEMVDYLLSRGADIDCLSDDEWHTPLIRAVLAGRPHMVLHLLDKGADPCAGVCCEDVVHCMLRYPDVLRKILEAGADPDIVHVFGHTPLDVCASTSHLWDEWEAPDEREIREHGIRIDPDLSESMQILIEFGASPYLTSAYLNTETLSDTPNGRRLKKLIDDAARNISPTNQLYVNLYRGNIKAAGFLDFLRRYEARGADLTAMPPWKYDRNLLHHAVKFGDIPSLEYLLSKGCCWEKEADYLWTAIRSGKRKMVMKLLKLGIRPQHPGKMWEALYDYKEFATDMAWLPLERNWVPEALHNGHTVLHALAYRSDYVDCLKLFAAYVERMGVDPEAATHAGKTPRDIAEEQNFTALLTYLDTCRKQASI